MNSPIQASGSDPIRVMIIPPKRRWLFALVFLALLGSLFVNLALTAVCASYFQDAEPPTEKYHSGNKLAKDKIVRLVTDFTIMPPHTDRLIETIRHVRDKDDIKGAILIIDSPGGLVSDSHEIYHELLKLAEKKPVFVSMKGIAASGGYYIAMGAGEGAPIYAEPTTWTGSIGVIMPRYNATELAKKIGIESESLVTGPLKETLSPLKPLTPEERKVWDTILDDSFRRFLKVIDDSRANLDMKQVEALATGQVYTANQALENGLIDKIGYEEDALNALKEKLGLTEVLVVDYDYPKSLSEVLMGVSSQVQPTDPVTKLMNASVPRAMYYFGWPMALDFDRHE